MNIIIVDNIRREFQLAIDKLTAKGVFDRPKDGKGRYVRLRKGVWELDDRPDGHPDVPMVPVMMEPGIWVGNPLKGWALLAYKLATLLDGQVWVSSAGGVSWVYGNLGVGRSAARIMTADAYKTAQQAKAYVAEVGVHSLDVEGDIPISTAATLGAVSRACLRWICEPQSCQVNSDFLLTTLPDESPGAGYHDCTPGYHDNLAYHDVSGYYYSMFSRLESLRVDVFPDGRVEPEQMLRNEKDRLRVLKEAFYGDGIQKDIRNSLVGSAMGPSEVRSFFTRKGCEPGEARVQELRLPPGEYRGAGNLIVRSGWEITRIVSRETSSVYSNCDCIFTTMPKIEGDILLAPSNSPKNKPQLALTAGTLWGILGFETRLKGYGDAYIIRRGTYEIGGKPTEPYRELLEDGKIPDAEPVPVAKWNAPSVEFYRNWL